MPAFRIFSCLWCPAVSLRCGSGYQFFLVLLSAIMCGFYQFWEILGQIWINYSTSQGVIPPLETLQCSFIFWQYYSLSLSHCPLHLSMIQFPYLSAQTGDPLFFITQPNYHLFSEAFPETSSSPSHCVSTLSCSYIYQLIAFTYLCVNLPLLNSSF